MGPLTRRCRRAELMDDPGVERGQLDRSLRFIRGVNRRLGGTGAALGHLRRWSAGWPADRTVTILDVGTGSADIPLAIARWARQAGRDVRITAVDAHPTTLALARELVGDRPEIELVEADARRLMDRYAPGEFDYAHAGMFLHHLEDIEVLTVLRIMDRLTTRGLIWNDLLRGPVWKVLVRLLAAAGPRIVRHDAIASVEAGFTRPEVLDIAQRVGLARPQYHRHLFGRFTLTSDKTEEPPG
jgi:Methyltransferase domain